MGIILDIIIDDDVRKVELDPVIKTLSVNTIASREVKSTTPDSKVVEVLKGAPGVQNVFVGTTPPDNPQEGWIWIDTSG